MVFTRQHGQATPLIILEGETVRLGSSLSYLDIMLENKGTMFRAHLGVMSVKAHRVISAPYRLMPNFRGPCEDKRRLFTSVIQPELLYSTLSWASTTLNARNVGVL